MSDNNNLVLGETGLTQLATLIDGRITTKVASATSGFNTSVVESLPTTGTGGTIYFVPSSNSEESNSYDEYIWITSTSKFELIGSTNVAVPTKTSELTNDSGFSTYNPSNADTLNKLSTDTSGNLLFDGNEIGGTVDDTELDLSSKNSISNSLTTKSFDSIIGWHDVSDSGWTADEQYLSNTTDVICTLGGRTFSKVTNGQALVCYGKYNSTGHEGPLIVSTDASATTYTTSVGGSFTYKYSLEYLNKTWYISAYEYGMQADSTSGYGLRIDCPNLNPSEASAKEWAMKLIQTANVSLVGNIAIQEQINSIKTDYSHENIETLNKFSTSTDGSLLFNGEEVSNVGTIYRKSTTLWSGDMSSASSNIILSNGISNYEMVEFGCSWSNGANQIQTIRVSEFKNKYCHIWGYDNSYIKLNYINETTIEWTAGITLNDLKLINIVGVNYSTDAESLDNIETVRKLSESDDGNLLFDGNEINGGSTVTVTQTLTSGTEIGSVTVGDTTTKLYAPEGGSDVEVTQTLTEGTEIGSIKVGDETTILYAPEGGSGGSSSGDVYYGYEGYSEEEIVIGQYFGKPLYRKCISLGNVAVTSSIKDVLIDGSIGIERIVSEKSLFIYSSGGNQWDTRNPEGAIYLQPYSTNDGKLYYRTKSSSSGTLVNTIIVIEYTKTSDENDSFSPSMVTDNKTLISSAPTYEMYSEEEKVVGEYFGKPLYQKCFKTTASFSTSETKQPGIDVSFIDSLFDSKMAQIASGGYRLSNNLIAIIYPDNYLYLRRIAGSSSVGVGSLFMLQYTKSTDAENSFSPSMITNGIIVEDVTDDDVDDVFELMEETDNG